MVHDFKKRSQIPRPERYLQANQACISLTIPSNRLPGDKGAFRHFTPIFILLQELEISGRQCIPYKREEGGLVSKRLVSMGTSKALCWLGNSHSLARTFMALSPTLNLRGQVLFYFFYLPAPICSNNNTHPHRHRNRRERTQGIMGEWMPEALSVPRAAGTSTLSLAQDYVLCGLLSQLFFMQLRIPAS